MHPDGAFVFEIFLKMFLYYVVPPLLVIGLVVLAVWANRKGPPSDPPSEKS
jgi:hypothetical protein